MLHVVCCLASLCTYIVAKAVPYNQLENRIKMRLTFCKWLVYRYLQTL
nr:MAG TPA: hypothetical protein [Caudoviricetes sp.]